MTTMTMNDHEIDHARRFGRGHCGHLSLEMTTITRRLDPDRYRLVRTEPYRRQWSRELIELSVWEADCIACGAAFQFKAGPTKKPELVRCEDCRATRGPRRTSKFEINRWLDDGGAR